MRKKKDVQGNARTDAQARAARGETARGERTDAQARAARAQTFRRVLRLIAPWRARALLSLLAAAVAVLGQLSIPLLTGRAIDTMIGAGEVDFAALTTPLVTILAVAGLAALGQWLLGVCNNRIAYGISRNLRDAAIRKVQALPLSYLDSHPTGDLVSRVISDVDQFSDGLLMGFTQLFTGVLTIGGTLAFMLAASVPVALVVVCVTPLSFVVASFIARRTFRYFSAQSALRGDQTALINERVAGARIVQAFGHEKENLADFDGVNRRLSDVSLRAVFYSSITNPATRFVNGVVYAGVGLAGSLSAIAGGVTIGALSCFLTYANQYTKPFNEISGVIAEMQNALSCAARVFDFLDAAEQTPDADGARDLAPADANGRVAFDRVSFSYVKERPLIRDFSLSVNAGERVAIVGPTGCGKTTLINLLMRFYDVDAGAIRVSGTDVRDLSRRSLRGCFGMVLQDTWLRSGTIFENIAYGKPDATREEVAAAARAAHADGFIRRMPDGYDTVIGEDGGGISEGQKQLLCIARVMLRLPPMLILDEATSSIDTRTELLIQRAFADMMRGRTSFIVAHRLSTIREADVILVMRDGQVVESGGHDALLAKGGFYAALYRSQFEGMAGGA